MADYSTKATDIDTTIVPGAVPLNPVDRSGEIDALGQISKGIKQAATVFSTARANSATMAANKSRADFTIRLNELQDAHDQGTISDSELRTRSRALLNQTLTNNPNQVDDLTGDYSGWLNASGVDQIASAGVGRAKIKQAQVTAAVDSGFLAGSDVGNPEKEAAAIQNLEKFQQSTRELKEESDKLSLESSKLELGSKQRADVQAKQQEVVKQGLAKIGREALPYWRTQYDNIKNAAANAQSEQERQAILKEGVLKMEQDFVQRAAAISGDTMNVSQADVDMIMKPQRELIDLYKKELDGSYDLETFERLNKTTQAKATALTWEGLNDEAKQWITLSQIAGPAVSPMLASKVQSAVVDSFAKNSKAGVSREGVGVNQGVASPTGKPADLLPASDGERKDVTTYLNTMTDIIGDRMKGKYDGQGPEAVKKIDEEITTQMNAIFRGVDVHSGSVESAKEFQPVVDFFANPVIGEYLQGKGVPASQRAAVARIFQDGYAAQVVPMLREELQRVQTISQNVVIGGSSPLSSSTPEETGGPISNADIIPDMSSGMFSFRLADGVPSTLATKAALKELNGSSFTKVLNKMIISDAHIQGNTDYQKSFEKLAPAIFEGTGMDVNQIGGEGVDSQTTGSVEEPDFELDDLVQLAAADPAFEGVDASTLQGDIADIGRAIDIGEAGGDYGALLGFTNRPGRKFDDVDVSNMTVDELLDFASPSGQYGAFSKRAVGRVATPMGRYQIVGSTLRKLKNELGLTGQEQFTPELQDQLFLQLLKGRGYEKYKNGQISKAQFISNLKKEWEGLKKNRESFNTLMASL